MGIKVGQELEIKEDKVVETIMNKKALNVKAGDKAIVTRRGIKYLTGEARGKIDRSTDTLEMGYDVENISKRIVNEIVNRYGDDFVDSLEEMGIEKNMLIDTIMCELEEYI